MTEQLISGESIDTLMHQLGSLQDSARAEEKLLAIGQTAIPYLAEFLLDSPARTIAEPRQRAARALGGLGAYSILVSYFRDDELPSDAQVLFAEDAVRSTVARELLRWNTEETYDVLLRAAGRRTTEGLIFALGEFCRPESVPLLFHVLEDDLCRAAAVDALRKLPDQARAYALESVKDLANIETRGGCARWRCRATLRLLEEIGVSAQEWQKVHGFLFEEDAEVVLRAAQIGMRVAPNSELPVLVRAIVRVADRFNGFQEQETTDLLLAHGSAVRQIASAIEQERLRRGEHPLWIRPSWRLLRHILDTGPEGGPDGAA